MMMMERIEDRRRRPTREGKGRRKAIVVTTTAIVVVIVLAAAECFLMLSKERRRLQHFSSSLLVPSETTDLRPSTPTATTTAATSATSNRVVKRNTVLLSECSEPYNAKCCLKFDANQNYKTDLQFPSAPKPSKSACPQITPSKFNKSAHYNTFTLTETFQYIQAGGSIARFGDGEIKAFWSGKRASWERRSPELSKALKFVASLGGSPGDGGSKGRGGRSTGEGQSSSSCLCVGTYPVLDGNFTYFRQGKRRTFAQKIYQQYIETWNDIMPKGQYCDSFISRPDGVDKEEYPPFEYFTPQWQQIFRNKNVLLVRGGKGPIYANNTSTNDRIVGSRPATHDTTVFDRHLKYAKNVEQILSFQSQSSKNKNEKTKKKKKKRKHDRKSNTVEEKMMVVEEVSLVDSTSDIFPHYVGLRDTVLARLESGQFDLVVLSLGQTATVLAAEISCRGYQALDVGQFGGNVIKAD
mmetsp:Transcript_2674/g.5767  ORF Transcript_2674/g.5767 Transcript_2674/m.5767 type:complete len:467 (-) Transcript_2674:84-1484(-)